MAGPQNWPQVIDPFLVNQANWGFEDPGVHWLGDVSAVNVIYDNIDSQMAIYLLSITEKNTLQPMDSNNLAYKILISEIHYLIWNCTSNLVSEKSVQRSREVGWIIKNVQQHLNAIILEIKWIWLKFFSPVFRSNPVENLILHSFTVSTCRFGEMLISNPWGLQQLTLKNDVCPVGFEHSWF